MSSNRNFIYFLRNINRKHRLSLRKEHNDSEVWYMHISPLEMIGSFIALLLILFIAILTLVAYTPILNLIPGYSGNRTREEMIANIMRVDSIERKLNDLQLYYSNVSLIMEGKTPITRNVEQAGDSISGFQPTAVPPSAEDSILRSQLEGSGIYSLSSVASSRRNELSGVELLAPVRGVISARFSPRDNMYGIAIATATNQQILATEEGTVTLSVWSPEDGYIIQLQHNNNLLSVYKRCSQTVVTPGSRIKAGEVLGYTGEGVSGESGKGVFEFELWQNGTPVDPETYIIF